MQAYATHSQHSLTLCISQYIAFSLSLSSDIPRDAKPTINECFLKIIDLTLQLLPETDVPQLYQILGRLFNPALAFNLNKDPQDVAKKEREREQEYHQLLERVRPRLPRCDRLSRATPRGVGTTRALSRVTLLISNQPTLCWHTVHSTIRGESSRLRTIQCTPFYRCPPLESPATATLFSCSNDDCHSFYDDDDDDDDDGMV